MELIQAHSPQAKGRVERRNAVFQDRLVKEMRLRNINDMAAGERVPGRKFLDELNRRYAVNAVSCRICTGGRRRAWCWKKCCACRSGVVVGQDWCVRWRNRWLQIDARHASLNLPEKSVGEAPGGWCS